MGKAVAVDVVAGDEEWFVEAAEKAKSAITHVIDTHVHADHYSGGRKLAQLMNARYCLHHSARINFPCIPLHDNDVILAGNVQIEVLHTPGHTQDSICLLVADKRRGPEPWFLLTGDTLFVGSVGRPDPSQEAHEMAGELFDSLHRRLLMLPDDLEFFPGHQAGIVCGAALSGKPSSTLGFERRNNPLLAIKDRETFIRRLVSKLPPRPAEMDRIVLNNGAA
ncbi:MAG: MBL fold metallo-hydrolase [Sulfuricaulis sp.]